MDINNCHICDLCFSTCEAEPGICKNCLGYDEQNYPNALKPKTVLAGKYIIGKVLGKGGFGITYLGYDTIKNEKIAIKEYMPDTLAYRTVSEKTVCSYSNDKKEQFDTGCRKFYEEAALVSKFNRFENIIHVYEFFYENGTAYFVMEYLDGMDLKNYIRQKGGRISQEEAIDILIKMTDILDEVHKKGIIHRDISPDNIFMCKNKSIKLIDFGAARQVLGEASKSLSVILKQGFAPLEQYQKRGKQGPWTDIYALGATIYYALTGTMVDDAMTRISGDTLNLSATSRQMQIILSKMLAIMPEQRYQNAQSLKNDLNAMKAMPVIPGITVNPTPNSAHNTSATYRPDRFCTSCAKPLVNGKCPECNRNTENRIKTFARPTAEKPVTEITHEHNVNPVKKRLSTGIKVAISVSSAAIFLLFVLIMFLNLSDSSAPSDPVSVITAEPSELIYSQDSDSVLGNTKYSPDDIVKISFCSSVSGSENAIASWDASQNQDNSITAWVTEHAGDELVLSIGSEGKIIAPEDMEGYFSKYYNLESVSFNDCFDTSEVSTMNSMFKNCKKLKSIDFSGINTSAVTNMAEMFYDCEELTKIDLSSFDTSNVTTMEYMFYGCDDLPSLDLSSFDTSNVTNMYCMFSACFNLTVLDLSSFDTSDVTNMEFMFSNCADLTKLDLSSFDTSKITSLHYMFFNCKKLTGINLSSFDTSKVTDMECMFSKCENIESLDLSNFDASSVESLKEMFQSCKNLKSVSLPSFYPPEGVDTTDMFYGCQSLTSEGLYAGSEFIKNLL